MSLTRNISQDSQVAAGYSVKAKEMQHKDVNRQIDEFLAKGGSITQCEPTESAYKPKAVNSESFEWASQ